jgi:hypothetical protein
MKLRFGNTLLVTAAGLALLAGSAWAQSADPAAPSTRSISVVATEAPKTAGADKTAELSKETPSSDSAAKALPPIPTELTTGVDGAKDKASIVVVPAPGSDAGKDASGVAPPPPPAAELGKEKVVAIPAPIADGGKDKAVVVPPVNPPPSAKVLGHPKTADVEVVPTIRPRQRQYDRFEHEGRYSGDYGHRRFSGDHCEH